MKWYCAMLTAVLYAALSPAQIVREIPPRLTAPNSGYNNGGLVWSLSVNPANNNEIIASCEFGGLWKSTDRGSRWMHLDGLQKVMVRDVCYSPDGGVLVATTAKDLDRINGGGIWVSTDGGATWRKPPTADPPLHSRVPGRMGAHGISFTPGNSDSVFAGTDFGIAVSADRGSTWRHVMIETASAVRQNRDQNAVMSVLALSSRNVMVTTVTGVFMSRDGGDTWGQLRTQGTVYSFKALSISPLNRNKVFVASHSLMLDQYDLALGTWTRISVPDQRGGTRALFVAATRSPTKDRIDLWLGGKPNLRRLSLRWNADVSGVTASDWVWLNFAGGLHDDPGCMAMDSGNFPLIYGCDGGLFKPDNRDFSHWAPAPLTFGRFNSLLITALAGTNRMDNFGGETDAHIYFTTQDNMVWGSSDNGRTFPDVTCCEGWILEVDHTAHNRVRNRIYYNQGGPPFNAVYTYPEINPVPNVASKRDQANNRIGGLGFVYFLAPGKWIRFQDTLSDPTRIYVSLNDGLNWTLRYVVPLDPVGHFAVSGTSDNPVFYVPFRMTDGRINLMKFWDPFRDQLNTFSEGHLRVLDNRGSIGQKATMFDWGAVFAVDPANPDFLIVPDVTNGAMKYTTDGGWNWQTDTGLTRQVQKNGNLLMMDGTFMAPYYSQVTKIAFDPYISGRILVGTREGGIIETTNGGRNWRTIPGTEKILYITDFFFRRSGNVIVSSYGRGLWELDYASIAEGFPYQQYCKDCIQRLSGSSKPAISPADNTLETIYITGGSINGITLKDGKVAAVTLSSGAGYKHFAGTGTGTNIDVSTSPAGTGFGKDPAFKAAVKGGEHIVGVTMKNGILESVISSKQLRDPVYGEGDWKEYLPQEPYLSVNTAIPSSGLPAALAGEKVFAAASGFSGEPQGPDAPVMKLDGEEIAPLILGNDGGVFQYQISLPADIGTGEHTLEVVQGASIAKASIVVVISDKPAVK